MRLTALNPSFQRPLLPAAGLPAANDAVLTPAQTPALAVLDRREPGRTPMSIDEFVRFARNAGAL